MLDKKTGKKKIKVLPRKKVQKNKAQKLFDKLIETRPIRLQDSINEVHNERIYLKNDAPPESSVSGTSEMDVVKTENSFEVE